MADTVTDIESGPGACLAAKRQANGLTVEQVAGRLKLTAQKIREIEADNFEPHTPLVFYRGYLKSYAALMRVPGAEVVERFDALAAQRGLADGENLIQDTRERDTTRPRASQKPLIILALATLMAVVGFWLSRDAGALAWLGDAGSSDPAASIPTGEQGARVPARSGVPVNASETPDPAMTPTEKTKAGEPLTFTTPE